MRYGYDFIAAIVGALLLGGCTPAPESLELVLRENPQWLSGVVEEQLTSNPEILFSIIEQNPEAFMTAANNAVQEQKRLAQARSMDEAFANPRTPEIEVGRVIFGNPDAPVTIVEYSDFQCPYCAKVSPVMVRLMEDYGDQLRVVYKHLPLEFHDLALPAARYFEAIGLQSPALAKAFHDNLFENQQAFASGGEPYLETAARQLGVDIVRLNKDLHSGLIDKRIAADTAEAHSFGITGTPGFLINGVPLTGAQPYAAFQRVIDRLVGS